MILHELNDNSDVITVVLDGYDAHDVSRVFRVRILERYVCKSLDSRNLSWIFYLEFRRFFPFVENDFKNFSYKLIVSLNHFTIIFFSFMIDLEDLMCTSCNKRQHKYIQKKIFILLILGNC